MNSRDKGARGERELAGALIRALMGEMLITGRVEADGQKTYSLNQWGKGQHGNRYISFRARRAAGYGSIL